MSLTCLKKILCCLLLISLSFSSIYSQEVIESIDFPDEIIQLNKITKQEDRALAWLIFVYKVAYQNPNSLPFLLELIDEVVSEDFAHHEALFLLTKAEISSIQGDHKNNSYEISKAVHLLEAYPKKTKAEKRLLCMAYIAFTKYAKHTGDKEGINYGFKALAIAQAIDFPAGKVLGNDELGTLIGYTEKDYSLALAHYQEAEKSLDVIPPNVYEISYGMVLGNIAKAWSDLGNIQISIDYKLRVLEEENHQNNLYLIVCIYNNLGTNYYDLKKYDLAEKYLQQCLDLMEKYQMKNNQGVPLLRMGLIQLEKGELTKAISYADAIHYWLIDNKFLGDYQVMFYQFKSKIAKQKKDYEEAIEWLEKADTEQSILNDIANSNDLVELERINKAQEIKQEFLLLENEKKLSDSIIYSQRIKLIAGVLISLLALLFSLIFYQQKRNLDEAYNFIIEKNRSLATVANSQTPPKEKQVSYIHKVDLLLKEKIIYALDSEKVFTDQNFTLRKFANHLDSNTSYVSKTINEGFGKNFSSLINEYRVKEILSSFENGQHEMYTIETLYKKAGFKSKTSFQKAFKTFTGVTASLYLEHIDNN